MYNHLNKSNNVLISGCGGGYDVFCGLDLFFNLLNQGKKVILGNYTFTDYKLIQKVGEKVHSNCYKITKDAKVNEESHIKELLERVPILPDHILKQQGITKEDYIQCIINPHSKSRKIYFPEHKLVKFLFEKYNIDVPVYCFLESGIYDLTEAYNEVIKKEQIDTVILADGGTDSLMTGSEKDNLGNSATGTPFEDISSIIAVYNCSVSNKFLYTAGFNVDLYHGVSDESFLRNTSNLIKNNGFLGCYSMNKQNETTQKYIETFLACDPENSIVNSHIISSLKGYYGDFKANWLQHRLGDSIQNINPFMCLYWIYNLEAVYNSLEYDVEKLKNTRDPSEIMSLLRFC